MPFGRRAGIVCCTAYALASAALVPWRCTSRAFAAEIPATDGRAVVGGYVDGRAVVATASSPRQRPGALADVWLDTKITDWLRGRVDLRGAIGGPFEGANLGTFGFADAFQNKSPSLEVREAYVEASFRNADLRIGVQSIAWGKLDGVPPTDVINPRDFHDPLVDDFEEAKIGIPAIVGSYYLPDWSAASFSQLRATLVYVPFAVPSRLPLVEERWFPASILSEFSQQDIGIGGVVFASDPLPISRRTENRRPPRELQDGGIALRLGGTWQDTDWDLYHYSGPHTGPNADLTATVFGPEGANPIVLSHADAVLIQDHDVTHMTGIDAATSIGGASIRAEAAFFLNRPYLRTTDGLVNDAIDDLRLRFGEVRVDLEDGELSIPFDDLFPTLDSVEWGIGVDYLFHGVYPLLQLNQIIILDPAPRLLIADPETRLTALVRRAVWQDRLELEVRSVYAIERESWFVFPRVSYAVSDSLRLRLGYLAVGGPTNSLIGQFHHNDELVLQARYSF